VYDKGAKMKKMRTPEMGKRGGQREVGNGLE
jgi:hypothetical protein